MIHTIANIYVLANLSNRVFPDFACGRKESNDKWLCCTETTSAVPVPP